VTVGSGQFDCQWNAEPIANQMALAALFSPVRRIWPSEQPPKTARTEQLSKTARDQSIWPSRESQSSSTKWIKSQIPSCCQSRNRRQQVMPEPQPSRFGSIRQGIPLRSTKIMPARQARSARRGRPPCGLGNRIGRSGSIKLHNLSGTLTVAMFKGLPSVIDCWIRYCGTRGVLLQTLSLQAPRWPLRRHSSRWSSQLLQQRFERCDFSPDVGFLAFREATFIQEIRGCVKRAPCVFGVSF